MIKTEIVRHLEPAKTFIHIFLLIKATNDAIYFRFCAATAVSSVAHTWDVSYPATASGCDR